MLSISRNNTIYLISIVAILAILLTIYNFIYWEKKINYKRQSIYNQIQKLKKSKQLYLKIKLAKTNSNLFKDNLLIFVQKLGEKAKIREKILSTTPLSQEESDAIKVKIKALNLNELLNIFAIIDQYDNIEVKQFTITKNFSSPQLLDLDLVLKKKI